MNLVPLFDNISNWCLYSVASLSPAKCKQMHICNKHNCTSNVTAGSFRIPNVDSVKLLGLTFNKRHKWNAHIELASLSLSSKTPGHY